MNQAKVIYLTTDGLTDPLGQSQILPYLRGLAQRGHEIWILSCEKKEKIHREEEALRKTLPPNIHWEWIYYHNSPPILSTVYDNLKLRSKAKRICKTHSIQIVHCRSYVASLVGLYLKRKFKLRFVFDMRGFWADEKVEGGYWNLQKYIYKKTYAFFKRKELAFFTSADRVVSLTQAGRTEITSWNLRPDFAEICRVIPCCADLTHFSYERYTAEDKWAYRNKLNINHEAFVLSYIGSLGGLYKTDRMLALFKKLTEQLPDAVFLFITLTPKAQIEAEVLKAGLGLHQVRILSSTRKDMPLNILASDMSIFFIQPSFSKKASSPTKMAEIMGMGVPILTNDGIGDVDAILRKHQIGYSLSDFSDASIDGAVQAVWKQRTFSASVIRQTALQYFDLEEGCTRYDMMYRGLLG